MSSPYDNAIGIKYPDGTIELERKVFNGTSNSKVHIVKDGEDLLSIAFTYYKDKGLWYVIADFNNIQDIFEEIKVDQELLIPIL